MCTKGVNFSSGSTVSFNTGTKFDDVPIKVL